MKSMVTSYPLAAVLLINLGCIYPKTGVGETSISNVISGLKDELKYFYQMPQSSKAILGTTYNKSFETMFDIINIKITLVTVRSNENKPELDTKTSFAIITGPSASMSYSTTMTNKIVLQFAIDSPIPTYDTSYTPPLKDKDRLSYILWNFREELLIKLDHEKQPQLKYEINQKTPIQISVLFDVIKKNETDVTFKILCFSIGNTQTNKNEGHQTMDLLIDLVNLDENRKKIRNNPGEVNENENG